MECLCQQPGLHQKYLGSLYSSCRQTRVGPPESSRKATDMSVKEQYFRSEIHLALYSAIKKAGVQQT